MKNKLFKEKYSNGEIKIVFTKEKHIRSLLKYSLKKKFYKYLEYKTFSKKEAIDYFNKKINNYKIFFYTIYFSNKIVGTFSIHNIDYKKKTCEIGYGINPYFWGRGIFKKLIKIAKGKIFSEGITKIIVFTREDNYPSITGLIKNNFKIVKKINNFYYDKKTKKKFNALKLECIKKKFF